MYARGNFGSRTTPHEDNSPPDKNKAQPLPTRTMPRTIPHQDNSPLGSHGIKPLIRTKTCTVGPGGGGDSDLVPTGGGGGGGGCR